MYIHRSMYIHTCHESADGCPRWRLPTAIHSHATPQPPNANAIPRPRVNTDHINHTPSGTLTIGCTHLCCALTRAAARRLPSHQHTGPASLLPIQPGLRSSLICDDELGETGNHFHRLALRGVEASRAHARDHGRRVEAEAVSVHGHVLERPQRAERRAVE